MILTCPACSTKYVVKDGAIPLAGRQVRCAACKHSWHQDPDGAAEADGEDQSIAEAAMIEPRSGPEAEERAFQEAVIADAAEVAAAPAETIGDSGPASPPERDQWAETGEPTGGDAAAALSSEPASEWLADAEQAAPEEFEPFYDPDPVAEPRRKLPLIVWLLLVVAALAAAGWFLAPQSLRERLGLVQAGQSALEVMVTSRDRQRLESGNELFAVSGRVINPTDEEQRVPPLKAELLDSSRKRVVYSWTIDPPAASLPPGASAPFHSAEVDVPQGGSFLRVTLGGVAA